MLAIFSAGAEDRVGSFENLPCAGFRNRLAGAVPVLDVTARLVDARQTERGADESAPARTNGACRRTGQMWLRVVTLSALSVCSIVRLHVTGMHSSIASRRASRGGRVPSTD
jgi:hypothetical protein